MKSILFKMTQTHRSQIICSFCAFIIIRTSSSLLSSSSSNFKWFNRNLIVLQSQKWMNLLNSFLFPCYLWALQNILVKPWMETNGKLPTLYFQRKVEYKWIGNIICNNNKIYVIESGYAYQSKLSMSNSNEIYIIYTEQKEIKHLRQINKYWNSK